MEASVAAGRDEEEEEEEDQGEAVAAAFVEVARGSECGIGEILGIDSHATVAEILPGLFCEKVSTKGSRNTEARKIEKWKTE